MVCLQYKEACTCQSTKRVQGGVLVIESSYNKNTAIFLPRSRISLINYEEVLFILILFGATGAWLTTRGGGTVFLSDALYSRLNAIFSYLFTLYVLLRYWKSIATLLLKEKFILLLLLLAFISLFWTPEPSIGASFFRNVFRQTVLGVFFAFRFPYKTQLRILFCVLGFIAFVSLPLCLIFPSYGFHFDLNGCRGLFVHKNHLGRVALLASSLSFSLITSARKRKLFVFVAFLIAFILLLLSNSVTSILAFFISLIVLPLHSLSKGRYKTKTFSLLILFLSVVSLIGFALINYASFFEWLGKDSTASGRVPLWNILIAQIMDKPFLGYGFHGFWENHRMDVLYEMYQKGYTWAGGHAHSGFVETALSLGIVGLILFLCSVSQSIWRSINVLQYSRSAYHFWLFQFLIAYLIFNLTIESSVLSTNFFWLLYTSTSISLLIEDKRLSEFHIYASGSRS